MAGKKRTSKKRLKNKDGTPTPVNENDMEGVQQTGEPTDSIQQAQQQDERRVTTTTMSQQSTTSEGASSVMGEVIDNRNNSQSSQPDTELDQQDSDVFYESQSQIFPLKSGDETQENILSTISVPASQSSDASVQQGSVFDLPSNQFQHHNRPQRSTAYQGTYDMKTLSQQAHQSPLI
ncbi:hypothetical protein BGZ49_005842 [Haplosporangium sp. Z 27]|nr:hypothetical protein BGZ49_005842 [Haplosporangium sp. Z 27]